VARPSWPCLHGLEARATPRNRNRLTFNTFKVQQFLLGVGSAGGGKLAEGAVGMDDAMAGDNKGDGIFGKGVADCPAGAGFANHSG
jgi:hypothetical protein